MQKVSSIKLVPPNPLKTAVLFLVFNRPDTTKQVFEAIRKAKPPRLYIAADGSRIEKPGEAEKVEKARMIATQVDWDCEVNTLFRDQNLGCGKAVSSSITWFFENEEEGIILEDDCLPSQSFFWFCEELLEKYRGDMRVWQICGFNPLEIINSENNYVFSKYGPIWGWASWKRAWKYYDYNMTLWIKLKENGKYKNFCDNLIESKWRLKVFDNVYSKIISTWDYQWSFAKLINSGLNVIPSVNLIQNIGFSEDATHTKTGITVPIHQLENISTPCTMTRDIMFDKDYLTKFAKVNVYWWFKTMLKDILMWIRRRFITKKKWNCILDTYVTPTSNQELDKIINISLINFKEQEIRAWIDKGQLEFNKYAYIHKKALEFFFSAKILDIKPNDVLLDAAGGKSNYLRAIKLNNNCRNLYLNDQIFSSVSENDIRVVEGDISAINLETESLTKISCHHAIEHFKEDKDILFIKEISRLLKTGGCACIVPFFIVDSYVECWNIETNVRFDIEAELLIDKSASLPGGDDDGHFARLYNLAAFKRRIVDVANENSLSCEIFECMIADKHQPDMTANFGSILNKPLRLLKLTKMDKQNHG